MALLDLDEALKRPTCPECRIARIRPADVTEGKFLRLECPIPRCKWRGSAVLPRISKTVVYLDTSVVSNMAKAQAARDESSAWSRLFSVLKSAVAEEAICCPGSPIVREEVELDAEREQMVRVSRALGDPGCRLRYEVILRQVLRALDRYLAGDPPRIEPEPPWHDAFDEDPHQWLEMFGISVWSAPPEHDLLSRRQSKKALREQVDRIYQEYAENGLSQDQIREHEVRTFGRAQAKIGLDALKRRALYMFGALPVDSAGMDTTVFDQVMFRLKENGRTHTDAMSETTRFLMSDHVVHVPAARLGAEIHAGLAMARRGKAARAVKSGDMYDVEHIATFLPYVDVFVADSGFAELCKQIKLNRRGVRCGEVVAVAKDVEGFVDRIEHLRASCPHRELALRITQVRRESGYARDFANRMSAALRARRGVRSVTGP